MVGQTPQAPQQWSDPAEHRRRNANRGNACLPKNGDEPMLGPVVLASFAKANLATQVPPANWTAGMIYVTDDVGGATPAFSDGTNWRRTSDRAIIA